MIGLDICSIPRIRRICDNHGERFTHRVFTAAERDFAMARKDPYPHIAARWAAKEAVFKVLGRVDGFRFTDIEVLHNDRGKPVVHLRGACASTAQEMGIGDWHVSITHERDIAACVVMATPESPHP